MSTLNIKLHRSIMHFAEYAMTVCTNGSSCPTGSFSHLLVQFFFLFCVWFLLDSYENRHPSQPIKTRVKETEKLDSYRRTTHDRLVQYKFRCPRDARIRSNVFTAGQQVCIVITSVRGLEMPVDECPHTQYPWCVPLLVPVVCLDDILYRCIVFSISNFVDALMIKMKT